MPIFGAKSRAVRGCASKLACGRRIDPLGSCEFAEGFRKNGAFCRADVGIGPYDVSANPSNAANFNRKTNSPQMFKGNCSQIWPSRNRRRVP